MTRTWDEKVTNFLSNVFHGVDSFHFEGKFWKVDSFRRTSSKLKLKLAVSESFIGGYLSAQCRPIIIIIVLHFNVMQYILNDSRIMYLDTYSGFKGCVKIKTY
jgi:hypothetical protein